MKIYFFFTKVFALSFAMGVVSGITMSFQFGTNWPGFMETVGNIAGPLLAYEVLTAFFLEATFLGVMLFGFRRVPPWLHNLATFLVAAGTTFSAFWILVLNSWMQTPQGFEIGDDGLLYPTNWIEIIFNPSFPYRMLHMVTAAYLTTAFVVGGIGAYYLWRKIYTDHAKIMLGMAMIMAVFVAPTQLLIGHAHGENTMHYQPVKVAAMEGNWERGTNKPLYLFGWPNEETETVDYAIKIPSGASWILTGSADGEIPGLRDVVKEDRPPVAWVFWSFRVMVGLGMAMILTGVLAVILFFRKRLFESRPFQLWCMAMTPAGFIAVLAGWFVTEIGRQPYTAYGVLRTSESISPVIAEQVALSLAIFVVAYTFIFGAGSYYVLRLIGKGPSTVGDGNKYYDHSREAALTKKITEGDA